MGYTGGVDLGGTKIQAVVVDDDGEVRGQSRRPTPTTGGPAGVADEIAGALREAADQAGIKPGSLDGSASARPARSTTRPARCRREEPARLGRLVRPAARTREDVDTSVSLGNDVQVATDAEFALGSGRPYNSLLGVFWGTGVGGGIVLDGKPWIGRGAAGEIGHVVVRIGGARCGCGRRGCMEAYAGRAAMEARARQAHDRARRPSCSRSWRSAAARG